MKYTFRFLNQDERKFREVLGRLDESEYKIIEDIKLADEKDSRSDKMAVIEMEPEGALTFRLGMAPIKIERERTDEEQKEKEERENKHKIRINVQIDSGTSTHT